MAKKSIQSVEPNIADLANGWLRSYNLDYKLEQESLNFEIDKALDDYFSKNGGTGGNRPDAKLLLQDDKLAWWPILIEYKGYKDKLVKLDANGQVDNRNANNEPNFKNINSYAVNGAVHYANALLHHTSYSNIISIGMTGYKNEQGELCHSIGVYFVSKSNFGIGQKVAEFTDFSFLYPDNFNSFIESVESLSLSNEEIDRIKEQREREITISLTKLNNQIYQQEKGLGENDRVYLVAASIIANLGIPGEVTPLEKEDLRSSSEPGNTDGEIILRKISAFLSKKHLPEEKMDLIIRTLQNTLSNNNINRPINGESQIKRVFIKIIDTLGIYYKIGLNTDFTGKLFNEMYGWLGFSQDKLNDVVLTPSYVATLLVKLARVNRKSFVWDFATGSAGLLVAAMNEMLNDAKENIHSPRELEDTVLKIKRFQLLGLEQLPSVYMLAILNMILMGDGSSNIINRDSLTDFNGCYGFMTPETKFPADAFVLNPPYSAPGNGMNFVEKALSMMNKGYAAIIIQNSAGSGKAVEYNKRILENNTLLASIKMPIDLFAGKSGVQTYIYVFRVAEPHQADDVVKFINFTNDGYSRTARKKANSNLKDVDHAKERYEEVVQLVRFGRRKLNYLSQNDYYEGTIDPLNGADWNQSAPIETVAELGLFRNSIANYLSWDISSLLMEETAKGDSASVLSSSFIQKFSDASWDEFVIESIFDKIKTKGLKYKAKELPSFPNNDFVLPALTAGIQNQGLNNYVPKDGATILKDVISISANGANTGATFFQSREFTVLQDSYAIKWKNESQKLTPNQYLFLSIAISKTIYGNFEWTNKAGWERIKHEKISLPTKDGEIEFNFMEDFISHIKSQYIGLIMEYFSTSCS